MHSRWKRLAVLLVCLGGLAFFLTRGGEPPAEEESLPDGPEAVRIPLPPPPPGESPQELARGVYVLETSQMRISLELLRDRAFRFLTTRGTKRREATGTWSLTGSRLTLAYLQVDGEPVGEEPKVAVNLWFGRTIELKDTGIPGRVVLTKRAMIKQR